MTPQSGWAAGPAAALPHIDRQRLASGLKALAENLPKKRHGLWPALHGVAADVAPPSGDPAVNDAYSAAVGLTFDAVREAAGCSHSALAAVVTSMWPEGVPDMLRSAADIIQRGA